MRDVKKMIWIGIQVIAMVTIGFVIVGFLNAVKYSAGKVEPVKLSKNEENQKESRTAKNQNQFHILILGDSIAKGTGDEEGKGLGGNLAQLLKGSTAKEIVVRNLGIDGLKSAELLVNLKSGKFDQVIVDADLILVSIGGNDLREIRSIEGLEKEQLFKKTQENYLKALNEMGDKLRVLNKTATMVYVGLYNPYDEVLDNGRFVTKWNAQIQSFEEQDARAVFIPTQGLFKFNLERFIAADKLHPNAKGYNAIAMMIAKSVEATL